MSKVAHYLQEHLVGEVMTSPDARRYFSTDNSIFAVTPAIVVYPRGENDIRKTARFTWQLAERGRVIPITARGAGTDQAGAALGSGVMLVFPAHMNRIIELDNKSGVAVVEPGINYGKLQQALMTHGRFLPPYPASMEYSTFGGAVANNASGVKSVKYGDTNAFVRSLRVVLANGEVIETGRLNKRELNKKLGLSSFEGEVYRAIDTLLDENKAVIEKMALNVNRNTAGYNLLDIRHKDGSFDLTPLFVGSQGTLGIVSEITCETESYRPETTLIMAQFEKIEDMQSALNELGKLSDPPSALELVSRPMIEQVLKINPNQLKGVVPNPLPAYTVLVEFDYAGKLQKKLVKRATKILTQNNADCKTETDPAKQDEMWRVRFASSTLMAHSEGGQKAIPLIDDGIVPADRFGEYLQAIEALCERYRLPAALWGHAGDGNVHLAPAFDLGQLGDRQKALKLLDEYYHLVISLGGSVSAEYNDGRLRGQYLERQYGQEIYAVFLKIKQVFDPYNTLNPGVKVNVSSDDVRSMIRPTYSMEHLYDHLPTS